MALLSIERAIKRYGDIRALNVVDLEVDAGEVFVLLGASGSGKTTLLRAIAGFVPLDEGRIALDGRDLAKLPPHRRPVNTMFQHYALFPHMDVAGNIGFGPRQDGLSRREVRARVAEMLDLVQLGPFARRRPDQLSGGQRQRVALARALARRPRLLLLDEPLSALDHELREQTRSELIRLQRKLGTTFVLVTHDQKEALTTGSRIGIMRDGRLEQVGTPQSLYDRPTSRFVATFLGAANVFDAVVLRTERYGTLLDVPGLGPVLAGGQPPVATPDRLAVAIRPERIVLTDDAPHNRFCAVVEEL